MRLIRFGEPGHERPGIIDSTDHRLDCSAFGEDWNEDFFGSDGPARLKTWLEAHPGATPVVGEGVRWASCVARPSKIVCIGMNYTDHATETGAMPPSEPILFGKSTSSLCGPFDDVIMPPDSVKTDWEVELAIVIGKKARVVSVADAPAHIAGYALHNDYSERMFQLERGGQWFKGKSWDTFAPLGPWLATPEEIANVQALRLRLDVNGERMQDGSTRHMIFNVPYLVSYASQFMSLLPGDVISTGTPAGVGMGKRPQRFLKEGDIVELSIDGLGSSRQRIVGWDKRGSR